MELAWIMRTLRGSSFPGGGAAKDLNAVSSPVIGPNCRSCCRSCANPENASV